MTMKLQLLLFVTVLVLNAKFSSCKIWEFPVPDQLRECYKRVRDTPVDTFVGNLYSWLCEHTLMNYSNPNESFKITSDVTVYLEQLKTQETKGGTPRAKRQTSFTFSPCVRKEYRMLTLDERRRYHNAVNALRRNTQTVFKPNLYTYFANLHGRDVSTIAHGGAGFLGWHRVYIRLYEALLKTVDPSVCLPYWDSTLDRRLTDPFLSSIWSPDFLGTPRGAVVDGPFANWRLANGGQLIRNVATDADLLSTDTVNTILSRNSYDEIVSAGMLYNIEYHHGIIHNYVAGAMATPDTAANDPVFFMHHAFIDYIFERFRQKLRSRGVNPAIYPREISTPLHAPNTPMRLGKYTQADGYSENTARGITYEPVPTCSSRNTTCGRRFLVCQTSTGMCLPTVRSTATPSNRTRRSVDTCQLPPPPTYDLPCQNDFCTRDKCDTSLWAMIPVKIVSVRPPRYGKYNCFPVKDGEVNYKDDIYSPKAYKDTSKYISECYGDLKTYSKCEKDSSIGQIFIYSHGFNYRGYYKESTIVDQKLTVSLSLGFVAVRKPSTVQGGVSKVLVRAHDACGRVCQVACRNPVTNEYQICSGAVAVSDEEPKMFGGTLDEAVMEVIDYTTDIYAPKFRLENIYFTFYCNYRDQYPFADLPLTVVPSI
ncbi:putative tyrosinase-like protein tyr-3 [Bulinus truncatus]|nr:putative tyrosinase-like protein tyr-3 [Bulinus truncatus]